MTRYRHRRLTYADVAPELIIAGAEVGWVRASGAPRRADRDPGRRHGAEQDRGRR